MQRCGHQLRVVAGLGGSNVIGFDMTALLTMAQSMGVHAWIAAEVLPALEAVAVPKINASNRMVDTGHGE